MVELEQFLPFLPSGSYLGSFVIALVSAFGGFLAARARAEKSRGEAHEADMRGDATLMNSAERFLNTMSESSIYAVQELAEVRRQLARESQVTRMLRIEVARKNRKIDRLEYAHRLIRRRIERFGSDATKRALHDLLEDDPTDDDELERDLRELDLSEQELVHLRELAELRSLHLGDDIMSRFRTGNSDSGREGE